MKKKVAGALLLGAILSIITFGVVKAHHPLLTGSTQCRPDGTWSVLWDVRADTVRGLTWDVTYPDGYAPDGPQPDSMPFRRQVILPNSTMSVTESVRALWSNGVGGSATATVQRPGECPVTTTTTTTQPVVTTTTIVDEATTTSVEQGTPPTSALESDPTISVEQGTTPTSAEPTTNTEVVAPLPITGALPATGGDADTSILLIVIAITLMSIGAVLMRVFDKR